MVRFKVGVCGYQDRETAGENGQSLKTLTIIKEIENQYGKVNVFQISSHIWRKHPLQFLLQILLMAIRCDNIIILPNKNGIRVILPLFYFIHKIKKFSLYYCVVGAWLPIFLSQHKLLKIMVKNLNNVFVETKTLEEQLHDIGVENTVIFPNFKQLTPLEKENLQNSYKPPYKLCFFSRVTKDKGIEDAIWAVAQLNSKRINYILDIYGPIDPAYKSSFKIIEESFPDYIRYCGVVDAFHSVDTIKDYFLQLFPTRHKTEGIPGSIIDSYFSGVPVLASKWNSCMDVIDDKSTGIVYPFADRNMLKEALWNILNEPASVIKMKPNCIDKAREYMPSEIIKIMIGIIDMK